jgi:hypothetical protein
MAVSEEVVKEQEIIEEDFKKAKQICDRIKKKYEFNHMPEILFALCLIYSRQLNHHKYEEWMQGRR